MAGLLRPERARGANLPPFALHLVYAESACGKPRPGNSGCGAGSAAKRVAGTFSPCTALNTYDTQYGWVQIQYQGQYYWVHGDYILNYACTYTPPKNTYTAPKNTYTPPKKKGYSGGYSGGGNY